MHTKSQYRIPCDTWISHQENTAFRKFRLKFPTTSLVIDLDNESFVSVKAYNVLGQLSAEVFNGNLNGYDNKIVWDASNVPSGVYFMQVQVGNDVSTKKVMLLK